MNWSKGIAANGQPIPDPAKEAIIDGVLVSPQFRRRHQLAPAQFRSRDRTFLCGYSRKSSANSI